MSVYYEDDHVTLHHGDCLVETAWLDADVLVTDPPYGRDWQSGSGLKNSHGRGRGSVPHGGIRNDKDTAVRDAALDAWGGSIGIVFGDPLVSRPAGAVLGGVYAKSADSGVKGARAGLRRDIEMIYLVGPWPVGVGGRSSIFTSRQWSAGPTSSAARFGHPHAKPTDLLTDLIGLTASGTVADPFAGSGSTLVAAKALGRKAIGVELDERYCEIAARRLSQGVLDFEGMGA